MQLAAKEGVRYTGGRYEFDVTLQRGSLDERDLTLAWSALASHLGGSEYSFSEGDIQELLQFETNAGTIERRYVLVHKDNSIAKFVFSQIRRPKHFRLKIKAAKNLEKAEYICLDKIVEGVFGSFKRVDGYHREDSL